MSFCSGGIITRMDCIFCLVLASVALLGFGRRGRFSSIFFPDVTVMVGFWPSGYFKRCSPFIDLFSDFYALEHCTGLPVGPPCLAHPLGTAWKRISLRSSISILLEAFNPGMSVRKLFTSVNLSAKRLKFMLQGLRIAPLRARFCLESALIEKKYSSKPSWISLRWLLGAPPYWDCSSLNYFNACPCNIIRR